MCVRQIDGLPCGQVLAIAGQAIRCLTNTAFNEIDKANTSSHVTCMCAAEKYVSMLMMNEASNLMHLFACLCVGAE